MKAIIQCAALLLIAVSSIADAAADADADDMTSAFLQKHCIRCHGSQKQKADRRFDTLPAQIRKLDDLERYQEI
ncbi:MAG: c-type cytochrome domain-containing protein, partial [Planctomycetota bacterium]|nr:c-type cytochrome domain-containing protein [Planctomycetota bacterium]